MDQTLKREEELKKDIVAANLRWEQRWTSRENEATAAHDALVKAIQQQRDRLSAGIYYFVFYVVHSMVFNAE